MSVSLTQPPFLEELRHEDGTKIKINFELQLYIRKIFVEYVKEQF